MFIVMCKETNEVYNLTLVNHDLNIDYINDFINLDDFSYDDEKEIYVADEETIEWWSNLVEIQQEVENLKNELKDVMTDETLQKIQEASYNDLYDAVCAEVNILRELKENM